VTNLVGSDQIIKEATMQYSWALGPSGLGKLKFLKLNWGADNLVR
jgi:hypothetical protein